MALDLKEWIGGSVIVVILAKIFGRKKDKADTKKVEAETDDIVISNLMKLFDIMKAEWIEAKKTIAENKIEIADLRGRVLILEQENSELKKLLNAKTAF